MDSTISNTPLTLSSLTDEGPYTIPALKEWNNGVGQYQFGSHARIVIDSASLQETGDVLAEDLHLLSGVRLPVLLQGEVSSGDIVLRLDTTEQVPEGEGYVLAVGASLDIRSRTAHGVFNGTRTVLQLLRQGDTIRGGIARDWPDYPERSLMVDMGRKYFSLTWLKNHIRDLAYLKYNHFHFHLSDNYGFRLESERHPEAVSPEYYTKAEIAELLELARRYHITIVPEIDIPGHMDTILATYPDLQLVGANGKRRPGDVDLSKEASYTLMRELLEEFIPLFPGPYWHIGADEYILGDEYDNYPQLLEYARKQYGPHAIAKDTYLGFVNWANAIVKAHGKVTRAWNDGLYGGVAVAVDADIIYEHWHRSELTPQDIVDLDLYIMNGNADFLYYVLAHRTSWRARPDVLYADFEPHRFHGATVLEQRHARNLGAKLHVWCDYPMLETEEQIAEGIMGSLRVLAQKNWGSPVLAVDYAGFLPIINLIGHAPGHVGLER